MHGVTGRMGMNQHLDPLDPRDPQAGRRGAEGRHARSCPTRSSSAATQRSSRSWRRSTAWSAGPPISTRRLKNKDDSVFFDAASTQLRPKLLKQAIAAGKHVYCEKPVVDHARRGAGPLRRGEEGAHQARRGAGQAVAAGPAQARRSCATRASSADPLGARRVRLLGVRRRPRQPRAAPVLELPQAGRRRHHPRHAVPLALRARQPVRRSEGGVAASARRTSRTAGTRTARSTRRPPTTPRTRRSSSRAA